MLRNHEKTTPLKSSEDLRQDELTPDVPHNEASILQQEEISSVKARGRAFSQSWEEAAGGDGAVKARGRAFSQGWEEAAGGDGAVKARGRAFSQGWEEARPRAFTIRWVPSKG